MKVVLADNETDSVTAKARAEGKAGILFIYPRTACIPAQSPVIFEVHNYDLTQPAQTR